MGSIPEPLFYLVSGGKNVEFLVLIQKNIWSINANDVTYCVSAGILQKNVILIPRCMLSVIVIIISFPLLFSLQAICFWNFGSGPNPGSRNWGPGSRNRSGRHQWVRSSYLMHNGSYWIFAIVTNSDVKNSIFWILTGSVT